MREVKEGEPLFPPSSHWDWAVPILCIAGVNLVVLPGLWLLREALK